jgi:hypothetical protein
MSDGGNDDNEEGAAVEDALSDRGIEVGSAVEKASQEQIAGVEESVASSDEPRPFRRALSALNPFKPSEDTRRLRQAREREEATWDVSDREVLNVTWISRTRHAEAGDRGRRANSAATWLRRGGILAAVFSGCIAITGFALVAIFAAESCIAALHARDYLARCTLPANLWEFVIATSSAALIVLAIAVALFRAAHEVSEREMEHAREMTATRKLQTAIRVIEYGKKCGGGETQKALHGLASALLSQADGSGTDASSELTSAQKAVEASAGAMKSMADVVAATVKVSSSH